MLKYGKIWGETADIFTINNFSIKRLELKAGFRCSEHYHLYKDNMFYVEDGAILVSFDGKEKKIISNDGIIIGNGSKHFFTALQNSVVYEIYWTNLIVSKKHGKVIEKPQMSPVKNSIVLILPFS